MRNGNGAGNFIRKCTSGILAMQGVPLDFIARLGGWNNMDTLKKYLQSFAMVHIFASINTYFTTR